MKKFKHPRLLPAPEARHCIVCGDIFTAMYDDTTTCTLCQRKAEYERQKERKGKQKAVMATIGKSKTGAPCPAGHVRGPRDSRDYYGNAPNRKCHDCGKPTNNYRCPDCQTAFRRKYGVSCE